MDRTARGPRDLAQRLPTWTFGLGALALLAVLRNQPGDYMIDNRFEQYWNPGQRITRTFTIWDGSRGLGWVREEYWPGATIPIGVFRYLGASASLAEHLWHATLITAAGVGCVAVLRRFRPVLGWEHLLAALVYMFGPFAATFLTPSNLFFHHALTPWLVAVAHRGVCEQRPWRAAATFALLVFLAGNLDVPGLLYAGVPMVLVLGYEIVVRRRADLRRVVRWGWRALVLTIGICAAALAKTVIGSAALSQRLSSTETPQVVALGSSWSESLRGMGFWVSYLRDASGPVRPSGAVYFTIPVVLLLTFAPMLIGLVALRGRRPTERLLFAGMALAGVFLMVGPHPPTHPSPWGQLWLWTLENIPGTEAVRSTYKAGITATLGTAILFGLGVVALHGHLRRSVRWIAPVVAVIVVVAGATPFWRGTLYNNVSRMREVPAHWNDAMAWLDEQPGDGQVLIVPGATRSVYRWGWVGDDIQDALMDRAHLTDTAITVSPPLVADLLFAIDAAAVDPDYQSGTLAPILQRLGIQYLVVRNDLEWRLMGLPRPSAFDPIRADDDLVKVAEFGEPAPVYEGYAPIEVYAVRDSVSRSRAIGDEPWTFYSGSGAGWTSMAAAGVLGSPSPLVPTAMVDGPTLSSRLEEGGRLVVTDSNRRQNPALYSFSEERSRILADGEDAETALDLYARDGSQSTASFSDATRIADTGLLRSLAGVRPHYRAAQAFDGDPSTGWVAPLDVSPTERTLRAELDGAREVDRIDVTAFDAAHPERSMTEDASFSGVNRVGRFAIDFSDGTTVYGNLLPGTETLEFPGRTTTSLELRILEVTAEGQVGIAEVDVDGLDLAERVRLPDDAFRMADADPLVQAAIEAGNVTYLLDRLQDPSALGPVQTEAQLRRELRTVGTRPYLIEGRVAGDESLDEGCHDIGLVVDGRAVSVRTTSETGFESCAPVTLEPGWHDVQGTGAVIDALELNTGTREEAPAAPPATVTDVDRESTTQRLVVAAPDGGWVLPGIGWDPTWEATVDGAEVGAPTLLDGQVAWPVPATDDPVEVVAVFGPASAWRASLAITTVFVILCAAIVWWPRRRMP